MDRATVVVSELSSSGVSGNTHKRTAIIVLGMHRSGTSALTRCLNLMGATLPKHIFGVTEGNETGHWEGEKFIELNNQLLAASESRWDDWRAIDLDSVSDSKLLEFKEKLKSLITEEYGDEPLILIKDPRICRFPMLYQEVLDQLGITVKYIIPFRSPYEVVDSLARRDQMTKNFALALWLRHVLDAECFTRGQARVFLSYDSLLESHEEVIKRISGILGIQWPLSLEQVKNDLSAFISPELKHIKENVGAPRGDSWVDELIISTYSRMEEDSRSLPSDQSLDFFSERAKFEAFSYFFGDMFFSELEQREKKYVKQISDKVSLFDDVDHKLKEAIFIVDQLQNRITVLEGERLILENDKLDLLNKIAKFESGFIFRFLGAIKKKFKTRKWSKLTSE